MSPFRIAHAYFAALAKASLSLYLPRPRILRVHQISEVNILMAKGYRFTVDLSPAGDDVASRELSIDVGGTVTTVAGAHEATQLTFDALDGAHVKLSLTDSDAAGNRSDPSDPLEFDATDQIPPAKPGLMAVKEVEQIDIPSPTDTSGTGTATSGTGTGTTAPPDAGTPPDTGTTTPPDTSGTAPTGAGTPTP